MNELADVIQQKTIKKVFDQRSDFIVIGLIGAIGTDISSAVNIFTKNFRKTLFMVIKEGFFLFISHKKDRLLNPSFYI